jgi:hypothetical protein
MAKARQRWNHDVTRRAAKPQSAWRTAKPPKGGFLFFAAPCLGAR